MAVLGKVGAATKELVGRLYSALGIPESDKLGSGCLSLAILTVLGVLIVVFVAYNAWFSDKPGGQTDSTESGLASGIGEGQLVPTGGRWYVENFAFVSGCGPGMLGMGGEEGTIEVLEGGSRIRASSQEEGTQPIMFSRVDASPNHAKYVAEVPIPTREGSAISLEMIFSSPEFMDARVYLDEELCVDRPAQGWLVTAASEGSDEGQGSPSQGTEPAGDNGPPGQTTSPPEDPGKIPANVLVPQPGEARLELSGETFTFSEGPDCTVTHDSFAISGSTTVSGNNRIDIAINGNRVGDQWAIGINAVSSISGIAMSSLGDAVGIPIIEDNVLYLEAEFVRVLNEDFENAESMGVGTIVCNCGD